MDSRPDGVKFVASEMGEHFGADEALFVSSGFEEDISGLVPFRAAALLESGIYVLWKNL